MYGYRPGSKESNEVGHSQCVPCRPSSKRSRKEAENGQGSYSNNMLMISPFPHSASPPCSRRVCHVRGDSLLHSVPLQNVLAPLGAMIPHPTSHNAWRWSSWSTFACIYLSALSRVTNTLVPWGESRRGSRRDLDPCSCYFPLRFVLGPAVGPIRHAGLRSLLGGSMPCILLSNHRIRNSPTGHVRPAFSVPRPVLCTRLVRYPW